MNQPHSTIKEVKRAEKDGVPISGSFEGIPYRGPVIYLKETDDIGQVLKLNQKLHVRRFQLKDEADLKEFEAICQELNDGHAQQSFEKMEYDPVEKNWVVLLRWIEWWYSPAGDEK